LDQESLVAEHSALDAAIAAADRACAPAAVISDPNLPVPRFALAPARSAGPLAANFTSFADVPDAAQGGAAPAGPQQADAGANSEELAKKLANPVASLISFPIQQNFDFGLGSNEDGFRYTANVQPVIPITLNQDWNLILRSIWPIIHQGDVIPGTSQTGLGDNLTSLFFSPNKTEPFIWGLGPAFLIPTATDDLLGTKKLGLGPTLVVLKQKRGWTVGALMNHIWSVAGDDARPDVNSTFLQPFLSYTTKKAWTFTFNTESTYDWTRESWSVPLNLSATKLVRFGKQPVSIGGGLKCWATSPSGGPQGCGFRIVTTLLFPKK
jgi:hypothetical protein